MSIDTLSESGINIKDLVIESPKRTEQLFVFDPEQEVPEEKWNDILSELSVSREVEDLVNLAAPAALLFPNRRENLQVPESVKNTIVEKINEEEKSRRGMFLDPGSRQRAALLQVLFPDSDIAGELGWREGVAVQHINAAIAHDPPLIYQQIVFDSLLLFPGIADKLRPLHGLKDALEKHSQPHMGSSVNTNPAYNAVALKLLYSDADPKIIRDKAENLKELYDGYKTWADWNTLLPFMVPLTILTAENPTMTLRGIDLTTRKQETSLEQDHTPLPEVRRF
jgi:hypothetical protein